MTEALVALSIFTGIGAVRDVLPLNYPVDIFLAWFAEVAGILAMCGLCIHVALAWARSLVLMRTVAGFIAIAGGVLIGMSIAVYLGLNSSSDYMSPRSFTHGELFTTLYCALIASVILITGLTTLVTAAVTYARAGAQQLPIAVFGVAGLLTTVLGAMGYALLEIGYPTSDPLAWLIASAAATLYGLAQFTNQCVKVGHKA
ncbi:hypothetical protein [Nocardia brasiliensis]|uniref:hypothetical protein n=1 Tax=Nocardia brasiliensis TaxID=37326 RepID=UPI00245441C0|nr:hypothetical protein [Nocardia brasiliensis]